MQSTISHESIDFRCTYILHFIEHIDKAQLVLFFLTAFDLGMILLPYKVSYVCIHSGNTDIMITICVIRHIKLVINLFTFCYIAIQSRCVSLLTQLTDVE